MCYHKSLNATAAELEARYRASMPPEANFQPVYHANAYQFPTWPILARSNAGKSTLGRFQMMQWGLIPRWAKTREDATDIRTRTINARSETIFEKPSYRAAAQAGKRCLIPVTGFYEWHTMGSKKFPFYITSKDQPITSVAGLWDEWPDPETGELLSTYTLLTTDANPLLAAIHNTKKRMPCLLTPELEYAWLHDQLTEQDVLAILAEQYPANQMHSYSISKRITSRSQPSDVPEVMEPSTYAELQNHSELFT